MKSSTLFVVLMLSFSSIAQNIVKEAIKNSNLQSIAEKIALEPGSEHTIDTSFTVEKDGTLTHIEAFSEYPELKEEGLNIIRIIKKLNPNEVRGKLVTQKIKLPITFKVETLEHRKLRKRRETRRKKKN